MHEVVQKAASRKGGRIKTDKGLAAMTPEKRHEIQSLGGKNNRYSHTYKEKQKSAKEDQSGDSPRLADFFGDIDE